ncbi:MAG TPA: YidC/Oxa1 family membrane protein insertase [Patescibacteria group bacterium]|nr:YidC/Oxa1 family membrane protein insertase [Patescibacteria group bacterium]
MLSEIWNLILINPILNVLVGFYQLTGNLGFSIVLLTILIRTILIPAMLPSMKTMQKQRELQPELDKIRKKFKHDKKKQAEMQMELFKKHGLNPASGCLTQIAMIVVLIALYGVIRRFTGGTNIEEINSHLYFSFLNLDLVEQIQIRFLWLDLTKPDPYYVLAVLSGVFQLFQSKMTQPYVEIGEKAAQKTPDKKDDIAYNIQEQMLYTMPIMNFIIGVTLPAGVVLYILTTTIFSLVQTYFVSGLGGLKPWLKKAGLVK